MYKAKRKKSAVKQQPRKLKKQAASADIAFFSRQKKINTVFSKIIEFGPLVLLGAGPLIFYGKAGEFENVPKMAVLQCGIILLALLSLWHQKKEYELVLEINPLDILLFLFYGFCWISLLQAQNPYLAVLPLLHYAAAIVFYFFICNTTTTIKCIDRYFFVITLSVMAVSMVGIAQYLFNLAWIPQIVPPASTLSNKNMAAHIISMSLPLCLGCLFIVRTLWQRLICLSSIFVTLLYSLYIKTRASWLAALVIFAV
jgi:hypothetical protein